jgi:hypothetical protein
MKSDDLIRALASDPRPVRRLARPEKRAERWSMFVIIFVGAGSAALGLRADLAMKLHETLLVTQSLLVILLALVAGASAFRSSVPGAERHMLLRVLPLLALFAWLLSLLLADGSAARGASWAGMTCVRNMVLLATAPAVGLVLMLRRAAPLDGGWTGLLSFLSSAAFGIAGTQLVCAKDDPVHGVLWHFAPVVVAAVVGMLLGRRFFVRRSPVQTCPRE